MVTVDQLCCLDGLIWLQSGQAVGALTRQHQTTVSRNQRKCARTLGVDVLKRDGFWRIEGDSQLLELERRVHQAARLKLGQGLRLEATATSGTNLAREIEGAWIVGSSRLQKPTHFAALLRQRVIDAWLLHGTQGPETSEAILSLPLGDDPEAMRLLVHRDLAQQPAIQTLVESLVALQPPVLPLDSWSSVSTSPINHQLMP